MTSRFFAAFVFVLSVSAAAAQELEIPAAVYPALPETASDAAGFVPTGWVLQAQVEGDLNKDGVADLVFVLQETNPKNVLTDNGLGVAELNTNPRILAAAFKDGDTYRLGLQNHTLIPRHEYSNTDDPFDKEFPGLEVARGTFSVTLVMFSNAGGWEAGNAKLTFRWQNDRFELIGWDRRIVQRNTGETTDKSANFSTGVLEIGTGTIETDKTKVVKKKIKLGALPIDQVGDGLLFDSGAEGSPKVE
jgi:hypothetical protein